MISFQVVQLEDLAQQGKNFNWKRPVCRCGNEKPWKHGFVSRYFDGFSDSLICRTFRCSRCSTVITTRPSSHFERVQVAIAVVLSILAERLRTGFWPGDVARQRALPWLKSLMTRAKFEGSKPLELLREIESTHHPNLRMGPYSQNPSFSVIGSSTPLD